MKIAMPVWEGRISPLFDVAKQLLIVEIEDGQEQNRWEVPFEEAWPPFRVQRLANLGVKTLLCGGISRVLSHLLHDSGIEVISQIKGESDPILCAYLNGNLASPCFLMPGAMAISQSDAK